VGHRAGSTTEKGRGVLVAVGGVRRLVRKRRRVYMRHEVSRIKYIFLGSDSTGRPRVPQSQTFDLK
jgi:hypothetical protein